MRNVQDPTQACKVWSKSGQGIDELLCITLLVTRLGLARARSTRLLGVHDDKGRAVENIGEEAKAITT